MRKRNVINLEVNIDSDQIVSYEEGLAALKQHEDIKKLNLKYLLTINEIVDLIDLTRAAFERNILENEFIDTGVRHLNVTGINFPRTKIYIDAIDFIKYLKEHCRLTYWKKETVSEDTYNLIGLKGDLISEEDINYLAQSLVEGRIKSGKQIEAEFNRTRRIVSRLNNIMESMTFAFPESQRQLRRFVFSPSDDHTQMEEYFGRYKNYENKINKIIED
jgi:hypothetical protein